MRKLLTLVLCAVALSSCSRGASGTLPTDHRVILVDRGATLKLLSIDGGKAETLATLADCDSCSSPVATPDERSLYIVKAVRTSIEREGTYSFDLYDSKVVSVEVDTGKITERPAFAHGPLPWSWGSGVVSPDGRYLYLEIPHNPVNAKYHPLHAHRGYAAYDLLEQKLLDKPLISLSLDQAGGTMHLTGDGRLGYMCCWVQGSDHPHPGITTVNLTNGETVVRTLIISPSHLVHLTRLAPAGDGRHFYALRAGSDAWWEIDARAGTISRSGAGGFVEAPRPAAAGGRYETALGAMLAEPSLGLLFSSLYLAEADRITPAPPKHKEGGGIKVYQTKEFTTAAHLLPDRTFEALALSPDGSVLYALDTEGQELLAFDTQSFKQVASVKEVGRRPTQILTLRR